MKKRFVSAAIVAAMLATSLTACGGSSNVNSLASTVFVPRNRVWFKIRLRKGYSKHLCLW